MLTKAKRERLRDEWRAKLQIYRFDWFVTPASNHQDVSLALMRDRLKAWDARTNRFLNGREWARRPDERLLWFAFVEKAEVNPHWHLLVQIDPELGTGRRAERATEFEDQARLAWWEVFPKGSFNAQPIENGGALRYVTKVLDDDLNYEHFVLSREFVTI